MNVENCTNIISLGKYLWWKVCHVFHVCLTYPKSQTAFRSCDQCVVDNYSYA